MSRAEIGEMGPHLDTGFVCLLHDPGCAKCTCGEWVLRHEWEEHSKLPDAMTKRIVPRTRLSACAARRSQARWRAAGCP